MRRDTPPNRTFARAGSGKGENEAPAAPARRRRPWRRTLTVVPLAGLLALTFAGGASAAGPYPDPVPDFAHPETPHSNLYSYQGGRTDRPMLVIYAEFSDLTYGHTSPPGIDAADMAGRFFGDSPSVSDYFANDSNGHLRLTPALETDASNNGAAGDGVVSVSIDETKEDFLASGSLAEETRRLLQAADPHVDFAAFDADGDGRVTDDELVVVRQDVDEDPAGPEGCATARRSAGVTLDGTKLGGLRVGQAGTDTNMITLIHEIGHVAFDMPDLYYWNVGRLDLGGATCGLADDVLFRTNAWQKLHLGWTTPTVVTEDGYYQAARPPAGNPFILYDPNTGTDDYFVVENRAATPETYDRGASDTGLVIWRLEDDAYTPNGEGEAELGPAGGFLAMMRPGQGQAWDPSHPNKSQRTMDRDWRDGSPSNVAVRAIPAAGDQMRVFFDVRGPGVLVDPHDAEGRPMRVNVTPEEANRLPVPVMNTGEATDTFRFDYTGLPAGWRTEADLRELADHEEAVANAAIVPAANASTGVHEVAVVGRSETDASVAEQATFRVNVVLDRTDIAYTGRTLGPIGEPAGFRAHVANPGDPGTPPVEGVEVTFRLSGPGGTRTATATTGADGVASADPVVDLPPGDYELTTSTERFGKHAPAATSVDYRVPTAAERVGHLRDDVTDAGLPGGIEHSLTAKLDRTLAHLEADRVNGACNTLSAFVNEVAAQRGKHIPAATADEFVAEARSIRAQLDC